MTLPKPISTFELRKGTSTNKSEPGPKLPNPNAAAQTRMVSVAKIRLDRKSTRLFKGIICDDISEFESHMPSHAVGLSQVRIPQSICTEWR
jgi:hypothetical protein